MRRAMYWTGAGFSAVVISILLALEGLVFLAVAAWLLLNGAVFWLVLWIFLGTALLGGIFAIGKVVAYGIGLALMALSGYQPEEEV